MSEKILSRWIGYEGVEYTLVEKESGMFRVRTDGHAATDHYALCRRIEYLEKRLAEAEASRGQQYEVKPEKTP